MICALGASVCFGTASVLEAVAARAAARPGPAAGVDPALLLRALRQWRYVAGLALDGLGFVLQIVALRSLPIYTVSAALASSLAVTAVVAARLMSVRLSGTEWAAVGVVCAGLGMLALSSGAEGHDPGPAWLPWAMPAAALGVLLVGAVAGRLPGRRRAAALGLGSGFGFGVVEVSVRLIDDPAPVALVTDPAAYGLLLGGGAAFLLLTSALQRGSVTTATAGMVLGETVGPALVGVVWLGDGTRAGLDWLAVTGFAVAVAGSLALARFGEAPEPGSGADSRSGPGSGSDSGSGSGSDRAGGPPGP
ncbi:hypothetical protein ACIP6P_27655 [Streptomyces sp. NPDC088729]|uniref:hypothetical protein n=1 Tax=Streptomyces sp. NPDC088729 TaxID=3365876 RepID=UPI0037F52BA6